MTKPTILVMPIILFIGVNALADNPVVLNSSQLCAKTLKPSNSTIRSLCIRDFGSSKETVVINVNSNEQKVFKRTVFLGEAEQVKAYLYNLRSPSGSEDQARGDEVSADGKIQKFYFRIINGASVEASEFSNGQSPTSPSAGSSGGAAANGDGSGDLVADANGFIDPSELSSGRYPHVSYELKNEVKNFEALGGKGKWFVAPSPSTTRSGESVNQNALFYLVESGPTIFNASFSPCFLQSIQGLERFRSMQQAGFIIILGEITSLGSQAAAAVMRPSKELERVFTNRVKDLLRNSEDKPCLILSSAADPYTLAHESQHLIDYSSFFPKLKSDLEQISSLSKSDFAWVYAALIEFRGYAEGDRAIRADRSSGEKLIYDCEQGPVDANDELWNVKSSRSARMYSGYYLPSLKAALDTTARVNQADHRKLLEILRRLENSDADSNISFKKLLPGYLSQ